MPRITGTVNESSPLTSPEQSQSSSIKTTVSRLKRQRIESDDEDATDRAEGQYEADLPGPSTRKRRTIDFSDEDDEHEDGGGGRPGPGPRDDDGSSLDQRNSVASEDNYPPPTGRLRSRRGSTTSSTHDTPIIKVSASKKKATSTSTSRGKGKSKADGPPTKRMKTKQRNVAAADEFSDDFENSAVDESDEDVGGLEDESEELSGLSEEEYDRPKAKGRGKVGARGGGRASMGGNAKKAAKDIVIKAKDEGTRDRSGSAPLTISLSKAKVKDAKLSVKPPPPPGAAEDMDVDVVSASSPSHPSGEASTQVKEETPSAAAAMAKKRKLPPFKKTKSMQPSASSTPAPAGSSKTGPGDAKPKTTPAENKAAPATGARKAAGLMGGTDLDLSDKSLYNELFKGSATSGSSRRAKDEERRKELDNMKREYKAKREAEHMHTPPFDLQAQTEKLLRFEERLRQVGSAALYPNYLAGKWRELWERDQKLGKGQLGPETQPRTNGHSMVDSGRQDRESS